MAELVFLKLGGSLITNKEKPYTPRLDKLAELASQIAAVLSTITGLQLLIGHGSGSFGHTEAKKYHTRMGLPPPDGKLTEGGDNYWQGFSEVHYQASKLNALVMEALNQARIPSMVFPPSACVIARQRVVRSWDVAPIRRALANRILPVIYGDVVFDEVHGGTILSTEDLLEYLAQRLNPLRILLAGLEAGVWEDFPARTKLIKEISPKSYESIQTRIGQSASADVTGGMASKVRQMLALVRQSPQLTVQIFSGTENGALRRALAGEPLGTLICSESK